MKTWLHDFFVYCVVIFVYIEKDSAFVYYEKNTCANSFMKLHESVKMKNTCKFFGGNSTIFNNVEERSNEIVKKNPTLHRSLAKHLLRLMMFSHNCVDCIVFFCTFCNRSTNCIMLHKIIHDLCILVAFCYNLKPLKPRSHALIYTRGVYYTYMYNLHPGVFLGMWTQLHICKS